MDKISISVKIERLETKICKTTVRALIQNEEIKEKMIRAKLSCKNKVLCDYKNYWHLIFLIIPAKKFDC